MRSLWLFPPLLLITGWACTQTPKPVQEVKIQMKNQRPAPVGPDLVHFQKLQPLFKRQGLRKEALLAAKEKGLIGESENGYILIRNEKGLAPDELKKLKSVVLQENKDRKKMYQFLSREQKFKNEEYQIMKKNMFESFLEWDPPGVYYFKNKKWLKK